MKKVVAILAISLALLASNSMAADPALARVTFIPQWIPQAQFAGYMMALEKGFYKEAGLDVEILRGGPADSPIDALKSGRATFCSLWVSSAIQHRSMGVKLVNLAQIIQHSALMIVAKKASGISGLENLNGRRVGLWEGDFKIQPLALFKSRDLSVIEVPLYSTVNLFLKGAVEAMTAMWYNEYHTLLNTGLEPDDLTTFFFRDYGLNFPEDGIYCLEKTLIDNPAVCEGFVQASFKGWIYAFEHQKETLDVVMKYTDAAHTGTNRAHQTWMLARMKDLMFPDGDKTVFGKLDFQQYLLVTNTLQSLGFIENTPGYEDFYRGQR